MHTPLKKTFNNPEYLERSRKLDKKCVCNICTCDKKHKCPEKSVPFEGQTTHHHDYKPYNVSPQRQQRTQEPPLQRHYDPQAIKTSYNVHYPPKMPSPERPVSRRQEYQPNPARLDTETEYRKSYVPTAVKAERLNTSPSKYVPNSAKFEGTSTYARQYSPKKAAYSPSPARKRNDYQPNTVPFEGNTTYKSEYQPHKIEASSYNRAQSPSRYTPGPKFEGQSRYRQFYQPHAVAPKERCPTEYLPQRPIRCSPGKDHLHYSAQKDGWD